MADLSCSPTNRKRSSFATNHFQRKSLKIFDLHPPLRRLVSLVAQINIQKVRCWVTDTQTKYCNLHCASTLRVNNASTLCTCLCNVMHAIQCVTATNTSICTHNLVIIQLMRYGSLLKLSIPPHHSQATPTCNNSTFNCLLQVWTLKKGSLYVCPA